MLLVDDQLVSAMGIAILLEMEGCVVLGPVGNIGAALSLIEENAPDIGLLDYQLDGQTTEPIIADLDARNVPCVLLTGYSREYLPESIRDHPVILKPAPHAKLIGMLQRNLRGTH